MRVLLKSLSLLFVIASAFAESLPPPVSRLTADAPEAEFLAPSGRTNSFTIHFSLDGAPSDRAKTILLIPGVLRVDLRAHDPRDRSRQNYPAFKMPDGSVPVLEASLALSSAEHPEWTNMTVGIPLAMLPKPLGHHDVFLRFSGAAWGLFVDGQLLDNDFPFGYPQWEGRTRWKMEPVYVKGAELFYAAIDPPGQKKQPPTISAIQYWMPRGHNSWVGDVETIFYQGRYHVFYLYDRRHHQSKFGCGAHYFEHISTADFKTWTEHEAATPLEDQWECIGTGLPFVFRGHLYLSYGLHTTRVYPEAMTTLPAQWDYLKKHGRTGTFPRGAPGFPAGATYAVSADGTANFSKSGLFFHPCQNPSVYLGPDGKLGMLANYGSKGFWESEQVEGGWHCTNPDFPPGGDCTMRFRWGHFDYVIGGFTGLWSKPADAPDSAFQDVVAKGLDFYDGSNVPSITQIPDGRFLMAAWLPIRGWGGPLVIRELIQFPDGRIGSKWMPEVTPRMANPKTIAPTVLHNGSFPSESSSFLLTFQVKPAVARKGRFAISFLPGQGREHACEFQIRLDDLRAQIGPSPSTEFTGRQKSLREGGAPHQARDFAIENLIGVDESFMVRVMVTSNEKMGGCLIDAEIAGKRTMISYRPDLSVQQLHVRSEQVELSEVEMASE